MTISRNVTPLRSVDLPRGWRTLPLKYGVIFRSEHLSNSTSLGYQFRYVDIGSVSYEKGIFSFTETTFAEAPSRARKLVSVGDTIISTVRTYLRAIATIDDDRNVIVSTGFAVMQPKAFDSGYLGYLAKSDVVCSEIERRSWGVAYPAVNEMQIGQIQVPVPTLAEQSRIATVLDLETAKIDRALQLLTEQIAALESYKKSLIFETVTKGSDANTPMKPSGVEWIGEIPKHWMITKVKYVAPSWNGLTYDPADLHETGTPVLRANNIQNGKLDLSDLKHVSCTVPLKARLTPGDVLICSRNGSKNLIGKNTLITEDGFAFGAFMMVARPKVHPKYFYYVLNSGVFAYYLPTYLTSTVNQLTSANFGNMLIPLCLSVDEQSAIVDFLDEKCHTIERAIANKTEQLELLRQQRQSLIFEFVTGKRRVSEGADDALR